MTDTSVDAQAPPGQDELVPDQMNLFYEWQDGGVAFELWVHQGVGHILADPAQGFELSGVVQISGDRMSVVWQGHITERPQVWLNAQRETAERAFFGGRS